MKKGVRIKHNKNILFLIAILIFFLVLVLFLISMQEKEEGKKKMECENNADCVIQQTTCCNCNMGGQEKCMSRQNATYWQEKIAECRKDLVCIALYNCKEVSCVCKEGKCVESEE